MILSAGNTDSSQHRRYPNSNMTDGIHDPAQAWNALTVGGYTEKHIIDGTRWPGWQSLAQRGDLAPCSCTSTTWGKMADQARRRDGGWQSSHQSRRSPIPTTLMIFNFSQRHIIFSPTPLTHCSKKPRPPSLSLRKRPSGPAPERLTRLCSTLPRAPRCTMPSLSVNV